MSEQDMNMPEYVWIYDNIQGSVYVSYNMGEGASLALVGHPSSDGITIKIP